MDRPSRRDATIWREWPWLVAIAIGAVLRGFRLLDQVPVDDEWHAIHRLLGASYGEIALDFGFTDHCIPLTLYLKLAADTIGVNEWVLRLPSFVAGMALLVVAPLAVRRHLGVRGSHVFAGLLAISPLLVLYSRFQRPYAIATLLSFATLSLFERWWQQGRARDALGYAACAVLSAYFLLATLPFVLAPPLVLGAAALLRRAGASGRRLLLPVAGLAGFGALLLLPPLWNHPAALLAKLGSDRPDLAAVGRALGFLAGTHSPWMAAALLGLGAVGAVRLARRAPVWLALGLGASAALAFGVLASAPRYAWLGFVIARYALPALPVGLACVAMALAPPDVGTRGSGLRALAAIALLALLTGSGGLPQTLLDTRAWFPGRFVTGMESDAPRAARVSEFYRSLAAAPPDSLTLVESPWLYSLWNNLLPFYERIHRQRSLVGFTAGACTDGHWGELPPGSGFELRAFIHLDDRAALEARGVDFVVFHTDLATEMGRVIDPIDVRATGQPDIRGCVAAFLHSDWPLVYRDDAITVFASPSAIAPAPPPQSGR